MGRIRLIVASLSILAACGPAVTTPSSGQSGVVPWISTTYSPSTTPSPVPSDTPSCRGEDIALGTFGPAGAAAGTSYIRTEARNLSDADCLVTQKTFVRYEEADGELVQGPDPLISEHWFVVPAEKDVASGAESRVQLVLALPNVCPPPPASSLTVSFHQGGSVTIPLPPGSGQPPPPPPDCGDPNGGAYHAFLESTATPDPEPPPSVLRAEIVTADPIRAGERFRYLVGLSNPSGDAVPLDPCPAYGEGFKTPFAAQATYVLNCSSVKTIPPNETVVYEMYLTISQGFSSADGRALLVWSFVGGDGPSASAWIEIAG